MSPKNLQNHQGHECYDQCFLLTGGIPELFGGTECREIVAGATVYSCKRLLRLRLMYCLSHLSLYPQSLITVAYDYCAQLCGYTFLYIGKHVETYWYSQTCFSFSVRMCVTLAIPMQHWNASSWCSYFWIVLWWWQHSYTKSRSFLLEEDMWFALKLVQFVRKDSASGSFAISTTTAFTRWTTPNTWWSRWKQIRHCDI